MGTSAFLFVPICICTELCCDLYTKYEKGATTICTYISNIFDLYVYFIRKSDRKTSTGWPITFVPIWISYFPRSPRVMQYVILKLILYLADLDM